MGLFMRSKMGKWQVNARVLPQALQQIRYQVWRIGMAAEKVGLVAHLLPYLLIYWHH